MQLQGCDVTMKRTNGSEDRVEYSSSLISPGKILFVRKKNFVSTREKQNVTVGVYSVHIEM